MTLPATDQSHTTEAGEAKRPICRRVRRIRRTRDGNDLELTCGHVHRSPPGTPPKTFVCGLCSVDNPAPVLTEPQRLLLEDVAQTTQAVAPHNASLRVLLRLGFVEMVDARPMTPFYAVTEAGLAWRADRLRRAG